MQSSAPVFKVAKNRKPQKTSSLVPTANPGAVVVIMDSANWLWPAVVATAQPHGWHWHSPRVKLGPPSALVLERTHRI